MTAIALLFLGISGCDNTYKEVLMCTSWYHSCNCAYECGTEAQHEEYLATEMNCDVACDTASMVNVPESSCTDVDGSCDWED